MIDSFELYKEAVHVAINNPNGAMAYAATATAVLKNYYLQLVTTTYYELTTRKTSPLISALCRMNGISFAPKNFKMLPVQTTPFNVPTSFDLAVLVYGLNVALTSNLDSCQKLYAQNEQSIFRKEPLLKDDVQELLNQLSALDEGIGKFFAAEPVIEVPAAQDDYLIQSLFQDLNATAKERRAADEMIIGEIKKVQLALQSVSPPPQAALQTIMKIRDDIDFEALKEPLNQLWLLFDKLNEILERHPMPDTQKGYERLIRRCKNFSRYVEQSLAMLGAEVINETDVPFDPAMHTIINDVRPTESSMVTKVLTVGLIYKGKVIRKANVEIAEPSGGDSQ